MKHRCFFCLALWMVGVNPLFSQAYSYPIIPDSVEKGTPRVEYLAEHFWDNADLSDISLLAKPKVVLDYLYVLNQLSNAYRNKSIKQTIMLFSLFPEQSLQLSGWLNKYLHDPWSPFFSDEMFLLVVDAILQTEVDDESVDEWLRIRDLLEKNRLGENAEDFSFVDKAGKEYRLYDIESPLLIVVFNRPDCSRCQETEYLISQNDTLQHLLEAGWLKILAICPDAEYEEWEGHRYPETWLTGYDNKGQIVDELLYEIRQYPSIYLLNNEKKVLLKEADYELLQKCLEKL